MQHRRNEREAAGSTPDPRDVDVVGREEELDVAVEPADAGSVRVHRIPERIATEREVDRHVEDADVERAAAEDRDAGDILTLPDGSISVPVFEEVLVVTKQLRVRERVVVRKRTTMQRERVSAELLRERVEVRADPGVELDDEDAGRQEPQ